jgi:hypothetical protein
MQLLGSSGQGRLGVFQMADSIFKNEGFSAFYRSYLTTVDILYAYELVYGCVDLRMYICKGSVLVHACMHASCRLNTWFCGCCVCTKLAFTFDFVPKFELLYREDYQDNAPIVCSCAPLHSENLLKPSCL